ncbi:MAG TPA: hypothetical protein VGB45_00625 [Abditibacterium sp.]
MNNHTHSIPDETKSQIEEAIALFQNDEEGRAIEILDRINDANPDVPVVVGLLGLYLYHQGNFERALSAQKHSAVLSPRSKTTSLALFHTLWGMDLRDEALAEIKRHFLATGEMLPDYEEIVDEINAKMKDE